LSGKVTIHEEIIPVASSSDSINKPDGCSVALGFQGLVHARIC
jgi:hypothetical protein